MSKVTLDMSEYKALEEQIEAKENRIRALDSELNNKQQWVLELEDKLKKVDNKNTVVLKKVVTKKESLHFLRSIPRSYGIHSYPFTIIIQQESDIKDYFDNFLQEETWESTEEDIEIHEFSDIKKELEEKYFKKLDAKTKKELAEGVRAKENYLETVEELTRVQGMLESHIKHSEHIEKENITNIALIEQYKKEIAKKNRVLEELKKVMYKGVRFNMFTKRAIVKLLKKV